MKIMNKSVFPRNVTYIFHFVFFVLSFVPSFGQYSISTTGGHIKTTGGSTSFAVGQVAYVLKKGNGTYLVSVCLSTYFLIKTVFLALGQKNETSLHRKGETEIYRGL